MNKGFSLIEILIVVAIATAVVFVVGNLGNNVGTLNNLVGQELQSKSDISQILQIMTTDIRSAEPSAAGAYPIDSAGSSSFVFYSDINDSGVPEHVRYFTASSTIWRGVIEPTGTPAVYPTSSEVVTDLIDNVVLATDTPLFSYYDSSYTGTGPAMTSTSDVSPIRLVGVSFYADVNVNQAPAPQYFSSLIDIRNLRSN